MKKILYVCAALGAFACCNGESVDKDKAAGDGALVFAPSVAGVEDASVRATGDDFFDDGYIIDVFIETNYLPDRRQFKYVYDGKGIFEGDPAFYFSTDDSYITYLKAIWPTQAVRESGLVTDQRKFEDFRLADWLTAEATALNVMPTDASVPLYFERENVLLEFEIAGQNAEGVDIKELLIEIEVKGKPTAFWAYCGNENGHAQILLDETTSLQSDESYLIGRMKVTDNYEYTIIFPAVDIELEKGKRYLVTLTSQGYDVDPYVYIGTFRQEESGIGIPFAEPEPDENGNFIITRPEQLVTMSYLIRHYDNPATFDWINRDYIIADGFVLTEQFASLYIPLPPSLFTGRIMQDGVQVYSLTYGNGQVLELYEN